MLSESDYKDAFRWYEQGKRLDIIADLLGITVRRLKTILYDFGYEEIYPNKNSYNVGMVIHDWNAGVSSKQIAETHGFPSAKSVGLYAKYMRKKGYSFAYRKNVNEVKTFQMMADWNAGMPTDDMVKKYGYKHRSSLCNVINWHRSKGRPFAKRNGGVEKRRNNERGNDVSF